MPVPGRLALSHVARPSDSDGGILNITENLHSNITVQDGIQLFQSGDIEHGQDVSIGRNYHFVLGPKLENHSPNILVLE